MPRSYTLRPETRALGAAQIMNGVIYYALGYLCYALFLQEEKRESTGYIPVIVTIVHIFWSSPFFIASGSTSIQAEKYPTKYMLIYSLVMNILSVCFSIIGIMILSIACFTYHADTDEYVWTHMAGSMLLQYLLFSTISEVICACITIRWISVALNHPKYNEKSSSLLESNVSKTPA
ncbi:B-lymphocyte antigen CD20-like isoform X1 [Mustela erminea]|uniref:B-lymphocyte antigen CD20-like isoform X1 n=1 Tax=Mustela erminea TaxID=36723 RepID=UPI001386D514|nr:B-lymphocyte antigen CD20-like isoform X1 [Mustela erminea]